MWTGIVRGARGARRGAARAVRGARGAGRWALALAVEGGDLFAQDSIHRLAGDTEGASHFRHVEPLAIGSN